MRSATFAAGCFWGVERELRRLEGVVDAEVGYTGGSVEDPSYEQVCAGGTGHAEAVRVEYDEEKISYEELLDAFFEIHDPTQVNRQGPDVGEQYRSAIFVHDSDQAAAARRAIAEREDRHDRPIATRIEPAGSFWRAEEYHQRYHEKRRRRGGMRWSTS
ncbi:MAG: peptide-methionine (S)-S-oxide reductase MsrA [Gemmatimonadota bacterium]|nr:peptide-methionine (S)-S-oxide reductase MsrA [Gemmatimonadota bacterium]